MGFARDVPAVGERRLQEEYYKYGYQEEEDEALPSGVRIKNAPNQSIELLVLPSWDIFLGFSDRVSGNTTVNGKAIGSYVGFEWSNFVCTQIDDELITCSIDGIREWAAIFNSYMKELQRLANRINLWGMIQVMWLIVLARLHARNCNLLDSTGTGVLVQQLPQLMGLLCVEEALRHLGQ
eukprot:s1597_g20.t1